MFLCQRLQSQPFCGSEVRSTLFLGFAALNHRDVLGVMPFSDFMLLEPKDFNDLDRLLAAGLAGIGGGTKTPAAGGVGPR